MKRKVYFPGESIYIYTERFLFLRGCLRVTHARSKSNEVPNKSAPIIFRDETLIAIQRDLSFHIPCVCDIGGLEQHELDMAPRNDPVLDTFSHYKELPGVQTYTFLSFMDIESSFQDEEHFVFVVMSVPGNLVPFASDQQNVLAVQFPNDLGGKGIAEHFEAIFDVDDVLHS